MTSFGSARYLLVACACFCFAVSAASSGSAQQNPLGDPLGDGIAIGAGFPGSDGSALGLSDDNPLVLSAHFQLAAEQPAQSSADATAPAASGARRGRLAVVADLAKDWHVYSLTQKKGGPTPTSLKLSGPEGVEVLGPFVPEHPAKVHQLPEWPGLDVEEHQGHVVWTAPISIPAGIDPQELKIEIKAKGLSCRVGGACIPFNETLTAEFKGTYEAAKPTGEYREKDYVVAWRGEIAPAEAAPGKTVLLRLTAIPDDTFHVYASSLSDEANATNFVMTDLGGLRATPPNTQSEIKLLTVGNAPPVKYHQGTVTWNIPLLIPEDAKPGEHEIAGLIGYQACTETSCRQPKGLRFSGTVRVGEGAGDEPAPLAFSRAKYVEVLTAAAESDWAEVGETKKSAPIKKSGSQYPLPVLLGMALIGGLILNFMPCVLPVVGLKLMALVESAGDDQRRILSHNLWYSFGLLSVFWCLAGIAIGFRLLTNDTFGWGQQFTFIEFRLFMILLVFVMALSFLGVWEIPLPGFASSKSSQQLQKKEGPAGAYFKGIFTTVLATPCSGPFLGAVFGFTLGASLPMIFLIFTAVGLGMALPYILIGLMPALVFWLPKPGAWMETFKQLMGFVLLGTVAFLFAGFSEDYKLAVFVTLIGAWFACWMIGRVPQWDALHRRLTAWGGGLASALLIGFLAFRVLVPGEEILPWEPYSEARLAQHQAEGRTVLIDFTASWCLSCKANYNLAINTEPTADLVRKLGAVPMLADWSDHNEGVAAKLTELQSASIPVLAIYPGGNPNEPIILRDLVSQSAVLEALREAGPSVGERIAAREFEVAGQLE